MLINGTTGEWFSQTHRGAHGGRRDRDRAVAGRVPVVVGCTALHRARGGRAGAKHALAAGAAGIELDAAAVLQDRSPDETVQYYEDISDGCRRRR